MIEQPSGIEVATPSDEDSILDLLRLKFEEDVGAGEFPLERARAVVRRGIKNRGGCVGVIRGRKRIEASIGLFVTDLCWLTKDDHLCDRWNFVHPQHRRSDHGKKLIDFARWAAQRCERPLLITHIVNEKTAPKCILLENNLGGAFAYLYVFDPRGRLKPRNIDAASGSRLGKALHGMSTRSIERLTRNGLASGALAAPRRPS